MSPVWWFLVGHVACVALSATIGSRRSTWMGLIVASVAPAATAVWLAVRLIGDARPAVAEVTWVDGLDISLRFRVDGLGALMGLLVVGIGALIFIYAAGYFANAGSGGRFPASLLAFATSMLGLVWADSIWTFFIFWELTSITSFLLVGHDTTDETSLRAARRALLVTGGGGLVLLAGLLILAEPAGTTVLTELTPAVAGGSVNLAAVLIMIGAATKSAQVPFHVWLPGAMVAPTPVSAYLHSATMVKAGVLLIAVLGPALSDLVIWRSVGLTLAIASMVWGAVGALRHRDAKLILAWGTVSQLGFMVTLLLAGSGKAIFAATSIVLAHALFKAALFLVVGEIDVRTGTRDIDALGGLASSMPLTFAVAVAAGLSMAGAPPVLGFAAKEAAIEAALGLRGVDGFIVAAAIVLGSTLTVAYTVRLLIGLFGRGPAVQVGPPRALMTAPAVILAAAGLVAFAWLAPVNAVVERAASELDPEAAVYELIAWPGITAGLLVSFAVLAIGAALGVLVSRSTGRVPRPVGADATDRTVDRLLDLTPRVIGRIQHGSLPVYLATMAGVVVLATVPFLAVLDLEHLVLWDRPIQAVLAVGIVGSAVAGIFVPDRIGAALTLGAVGIGVSGLFAVHGAPDLVLTQLLVETIVVVGFVVGLGHLRRRFPETSSSWRWTRVTVSALAGLGVTVALIAAGSAPTGRPPVEELVAASVEDGGGNNVVNVILTDTRALDTLGEVVVLATVAVGVLALAAAASPKAAR